MPDKTPDTKKDKPLTLEEQLAAKDAEIAELKAKLGEPPEPPPFQEYPKWVNGVIVADKKAEDAAKDAAKYSEAKQPTTMKG